MRLQKYLASCGIASRRKCEELILSGMIRVNGKVINVMGYKVVPGDRIEYQGHIVTPKVLFYAVLNKPEGYLCSRGDQWGRKTVYDLFPANLNGIFTVGRLDYQSTGLIVVTNDGDLTQELSHPSRNLVKKYRVVTETPIDIRRLREFERGVTVLGIDYRALSCRKTGENEAVIELQEGKKREIREVFKYFQWKVLSLERIGIGSLSMEDAGISPGEYKVFNKEELLRLIYG